MLETEGDEGGREKRWQELDALLTGHAKGDLVAAVEAIPADEVGRFLALLPQAERAALLDGLPPKTAGYLMGEIDEVQAARIASALPAGEVAVIIDSLPEGSRADILDEMQEGAREAVLGEMPAAMAEGERARRRHEQGSAGELMTNDYLAYPEGMPIGEVIDDMRRHAEDYSDYAVQYAYVTTDDGVLVGVLPLRDLLLARSGATTDQVMVEAPLSVRDDSPLERLVSLFRERSFLGIPVTEDGRKLVGVLSRRRVLEAEARRSRKAFLSISGIVGGEELRSMNTVRRSLRRLSWLAPNILLNILAASVIAAHQATLESVIALAVFLPIVSDMSGCSGNQAVAVSIRELSLGIAQPRDVLRVLFKEIAVGLPNGLVLGVVLGTVAALWQGNVYLGLVVGSALALNTVLSVMLGGLVPLFLKRFGVDPALASGPILTTCTDMCGFFLVLSLAGRVLSHL